MFQISSVRFRAVARNALTWAAAWAVAGGAIVATISLVDPGPGVESLVERVGEALIAGVAWGVRFGIAGAAIGTLFSSVVRLGYRGRRLADISPLRFGLLGAVVGGAGVPLFLQTMNVLSGDGPVAWHLVLDDGVWATVFGATVAAGSILLARRADRLQRPTRAAEVGPGAGSPRALPEGAERWEGTHARSPEGTARGERP